MRGRCLLLSGGGIGVGGLLLLLLVLLRHPRSRWHLGCFVAGVSGGRVVLLWLLLLLELLVSCRWHLASGMVLGTLVHGRVVDGCSKFLRMIVCRLGTVVHGLVGFSLRWLLLQWRATCKLGARIGRMRCRPVRDCLFCAIVGSLRLGRLLCIDKLANCGSDMF